MHKKQVKMKQRILNLINSYSFEEKAGKFISSKIWKDIYTYQSLKTNNLSKNKSISQIHKLELTDEVLLLIQNGITDKDSLIITESFMSIAFSNWFGSNKLTKIKWNEVSSIDFCNHSLIFNFLDDNKLDFDANTIFSKNKEKSSILVELLQNVLKITKGEKPKIASKSNKKLYQKLLLIGIVLLVLVFSGVFVFYDEVNNKININDISSFQDEIDNQTRFDTIWSETLKEEFTEITMLNAINVFNEPYQVTMQAHKIAGLIHTGGDRIVIPVEIPKQTLYWFYKLNLTNAKIESRQAKLIDDVNKNKDEKQWKIVGAINAVTKANLVNTLATTLLDNIEKPSLEKPFTNVFFINKEADARKFIENLEFDYDINNSIKNTHSRNGLIKFNENKFVYLGLENEGYSDNIYVALEVVAITEETKYFKLIEK